MEMKKNIPQTCTVTVMLTLFTAYSTLKQREPTQSASETDTFTFQFQNMQKAERKVCFSVLSHYCGK